MRNEEAGRELVDLVDDVDSVDGVDVARLGGATECGVRNERGQD